ncbi:MAG TPA: hypothetical protein PKL69_13025 [Agitococcus sp.]|nr:hypothetical protein [Agitococcus sp.]HMY29242.1 hypothetical protein [Agitococcus sp.]HNA22160.1 hypothetical protein [Agitococcus sp.]HNC87045.1 hypothetical protein [Agitococcus sp.]HNI63196.1 hypothetical protein [Agitococcus sp.]
MSESRKAGSIILANLAMFNEAVVLFENEIQPQFLLELDKAIESWTKEQEWIGQFEEHTDGQTWLLPQEWLYDDAEGEKSSQARFTLGFFNGDSNAYYLADLCNVGQDEMGFIFQVKYGEFGGKTAWNKFAKSVPISIVETLQGLGFNDCGKGVFFIPIKLNPNLLVSAWENEDYEELMQPVIVVLENIKQSVAIFNEVFSLAKQAGLGRIE